VKPFSEYKPGDRVMVKRFGKDEWNEGIVDADSNDLVLRGRYVKPVDGYLFWERFLNKQVRDA